MASVSGALPQKTDRRAIVSWALFDWAAQPFFTLITTFVFSPYFASVLAKSPEQGQSLWGFATAAAGLGIALMAPILGSVADATGRRKLWIFVLSIPFVICCWMFWYAAPGGSNSIAIALIAFAIGTLCIEIATVFNNAMMPSLVPHEPDTHKKGGHRRQQHRCTNVVHYRFCPFPVLV